MHTDVVARSQPGMSSESSSTLFLEAGFLTDVEPTSSARLASC